MLPEDDHGRRRTAQLGAIGLPGVGAVLTDKAYDAFDTPCHSHDYAYDILRFAQRELDYKSVFADRASADGVFHALMKSVCGETGYFGIFNKGSCHYMSGVMYTGVRAWTSGQRGF
jgi:hypothetical protein